MSKTTENTRLVIALILIIMIVGIGGYFMFCLGGTAIGQKFQFPFFQSESQIPLTPFEEQTFLQRSYEKNLQNDIISSLEKTLGQGMVQATVRATLDLTQKTTFSEQDSKNRFQTEQTKVTSGQIQKLSVSVLLNGKTTKNKSGHEIYQPLNKVDIQKYKNLVQAIIGFNQQRGDTIEVLNIPFHETSTIWNISVDIWGIVLYWGLAGTLVFLFIVFFIIPLIKNLIYTNNSEHKPIKNKLLEQIISLFTENPERVTGLIKTKINQAQYRKNPRQYTPAEKMGIVLLAVGDSVARLVLSRLSKDEIRHLGRVISSLGTVSASDIKSSLEEFISDYHMPRGLIGTNERTKEILTQSLPNGQAIYSEIRLSEGHLDIWNKINELDTGLLVSFLKKQKPETVALILFHLDNTVSGRLLTLLPTDISTRVIIHLSHLQRIKPDVLEKLKDEIAEELYILLQQNKQPNGNEKIADILKTLPQQDKQDFMDTLNRTEPETAQKVKTYLHQWNDISKLSGEKIKTLLKYSDKDVMMLALAESNVQIQAAIARQLPSPLWDNMIRQMKQLTPDDKRQSVAAQQTILKTAQELKLFN